MLLKTEEDKALWCSIYCNIMDQLYSKGAIFGSSRTRGEGYNQHCSKMADQAVRDYRERTEE